MLHKPYLFVQHLAFSFNVSAIMPAYLYSFVSCGMQIHRII